MQFKNRNMLFPFPPTSFQERPTALLGRGGDTEGRLAQTVQPGEGMAEQGYLGAITGRLFLPVRGASDVSKCDGQISASEHDKSGPTHR